MTCRDRILSNDYVDLILDFPLADFVPQESEEQEYCISLLGDDFSILYSRGNYREEMALNSYQYRYVPKLYGLMQESYDTLALDAAGISSVQRAPLSLNGEGVILAFIDTGIDYTSEAFRTPTGDSRILAIWDQTIQEGITPEGIPYGSLYTRETINLALAAENPLDVVPSRDENGHGTALASVAAGSSLPARGFSGAAPLGDILVVKLKECKPYLREYYRISQAPAYSEADVMQGVKFVRSYLQAFTRPVVLCLGLGTNMGDHTGSSPLAQYLDQTAARRSMTVVVCSGNEGNKGHHFAGKLQPGLATADYYQDAEIRVGEGENGFLLELWGAAPDTFQLQIRSPGGETITATRESLTQSITYRFVYENTRISAYQELVEAGSGAQLILLRFIDPTPGVWRIRVTGVGEVEEGTFHIWMPIAQFLSGNTYFLEPNPYITITEPGNAGRVITVSPYNDVNNSFYLESGRGYTRDGRIKPDFAAPGVNIPGINGRRTGSSVSAAIVAGGAAQFMEWAILEGNRPFVTSVESKNYFIRGAVRSADINYPDREWGYGRFNLAKTFETLAGV